MKKRLFYYWDILQKDETELVKKVFSSQKSFSVKNDWVLQVQSDLDECDIQLNESEIAKMKICSFAKLINEKINQISAQYLIGLREKQSKSDNLKYSTEMQSYLCNEKVSIQGKKLMFRLKNRLLDVKCNFKKKYNNRLECRLCSATEESQSHLMECKVILEDNDVKKAIGSSTYNDTFSTNLEIQTKLIKTWQAIMKVRKLKLKNISD